ncbi:hypothetical protein QTP86_030827 [Hemibagrus guttatus]|nr:hypothetical protein QTP86_030827 [Hemibagrus guttatus]
MAATKLPPHQPWDCAIDLLPENKAMEEYISEALQRGFIRPSTSPAASSFFFVAKKDGGLRPCIDYRVLNSQMIIKTCSISGKLDQVMGHIRAATEEEPAPPGGPDGKAYVPTSLRLSLLDSVHASPGSGHPGRQRTLSLLKERYWWPNMAEEVARFVRGWSVCAMVSTSRRLPEGKLVSLPIQRHPWSHLGIDFATDLPVSNGFTTILVTIDRFSKACKLIPLKGLPTALETAEALFSKVFRHFGILEDIVSHRRPQFISRVWRGFFKLLGVSVSLSSGYHPQTNGQTERNIQEIGRYIGPTAMTISMTRANTSPGPTEPSEVPTVDHWFRESERVWESVHIHLQRAVQCQKVQADVRRHDAPLYHPGDKVWLPCKKLSPCNIGPFTILRQINDVTSELQLPCQYHISPTFHVSLLKPFIDPVLPPPTEPEVPPPPEIDTDDTIYQVREVVNSR